MKIFRKIRFGALQKRSVSNYIIYAIGEIILVVIGILIALYINDISAESKKHALEIEILKGIQNDIIADTLDMDFNKKAYQKLILRGQSVLERLKKRDPLDSAFAQDLDILANASDFTITLHHSTYYQAKEKGLSIIGNKDLRQKISHLYEFRYENLKNQENEHKLFEHYLILNQKIRKLLEYHNSQIKISEATYSRLCNNYNFHYLLNNKIEIQKTFHNIIYKNNLKYCREILNLIENEISMQ